MWLSTLCHEISLREGPPFSSICVLFNFSTRGTHETRRNVEMRSTVRPIDCLVLVHSIFL